MLGDTKICVLTNSCLKKLMVCTYFVGITVNRNILNPHANTDSDFLYCIKMQHQQTHSF